MYRVRVFCSWLFFFKNIFPCSTFGFVLYIFISIGKLLPSKGSLLGKTLFNSFLLQVSWEKYLRLCLTIFFRVLDKRSFLHDGWFVRSDARLILISYRYWRIYVDNVILNILHSKGISLTRLPISGRYKQIFDLSSRQRTPTPPKIVKSVWLMEYKSARIIGQYRYNFSRQIPASG